MAWAHMASSRVGSLIFIDDVTHDEFRGLQNHSVCQLMEKCIQTNWEELYHATRQ